MTNTTKNRHGVTVCGRCLSAMCETLSSIRTPHNTPCVTVADAEAMMAQAAPKPAAIVAECWTCVLGDKPRPLAETRYSYILGCTVKEHVECLSAGHDVRPVAEGKVTR